MDGKSKNKNESNKQVLEIDSTKKLDEEDNEMMKSVKDTNTNNKKEDSEEKGENKYLTTEDNIDDFDEKKDFDYNSFLNTIRNYCEKNAKEKVKYIDNKFLFLLCRDGKITKEELQKIEKKPELLEILIDTYIDMIKESQNEENEDQKKDQDKEVFIQHDTKPIDDEEIIKEFFKGDDSNSDDNYNIPIPPPPPPSVPIISNENQQEGGES